VSRCVAVQGATGHLEGRLVRNMQRAHQRNRVLGGRTAKESHFKHRPAHSALQLLSPLSGRCRRATE
jgi:hypothetical protein